MAPEGKKQVAVPKTARLSSSEAAVGDAVVGKALRSAYQRTVNEGIPADLLALLGKLD